MLTEPSRCYTAAAAPSPAATTSGRRNPENCCRVHENVRQMFRHARNLPPPSPATRSRDLPSGAGGRSGTTNISIKISRSTERRRPSPSDQKRVRGSSVKNVSADGAGPARRRRLRCWVSVTGGGVGSRAQVTAAGSPLPTIPQAALGAGEVVA